MSVARGLGATHTVLASTTDAFAELAAIAGPGGFDVAIETTGVADVIETAYEATSARGRVVLVGVPRKSARHPSFYTLPLHFDKVLTGSEGGGSRPDLDIPKLIRLHEAGKLSLKGLISRRVTLDRINDAIGELRAGSVPGRCIVWMERGT